MRWEGGVVERVGWRSGVGGRLKGPTVLPHMQAECGRAAYVWDSLSCVETLHIAIAHCYCTVHTAQCILHIPYWTLHVAYCIFNIAHCTLHKLHIAHCTLYIAYCTLHRACSGYVGTCSLRQNFLCSVVLPCRCASWHFLKGGSVWSDACGLLILRACGHCTRLSWLEYKKYFLTCNVDMQILVSMSNQGVIGAWNQRPISGW